MALLLSQLGTIGSGLVIALIYNWKLTLIVVSLYIISTVAFIIGRKVIYSKRIYNLSLICFASTVSVTCSLKLSTLYILASGLNNS